MSPPSPRILVVDDVAENRDLLVRRLKRLELTNVDQAVNGVEALAALAARPYDLVLLDIMMPELDGFGVLTALREQGRVNDMPVIVISAMNEIDAVVRCIELGAEDFLFKPFNPTLLRARVLASLEKKALRDQTREELRRKQYELNEARTLQMALVPPPFFGTRAGVTFSVDVALEPAKEVGGDLVDHFLIADRLLVLILGDVSDKGAGAALMMARTHAMFRGLASRPDSRELFTDPANAVNIANAALSIGNLSCMFATLFVATLDLDTRELRYVRAGHVPPFHRGPSGEVSRLPGRGGPPLALFEDFIYQQATVTLSSGDRLLALTDGFTEAHDAAQQLYGEQRIETFLAALDGSAPDPLPGLISTVRSFESGLPAFDDMAAILLTLKDVP